MRIGDLGVEKPLALKSIALSYLTSVSNDAKWYFWLDRWKDVFRHSTDEVTLNLIPRSVIINRTLATIMAILVHDCVYKETFS